MEGGWVKYTIKCSVMLNIQGHTKYKANKCYIWLFINVSLI